ncbi:adhesion G-protein coupled receptor F3-like [Hyla sarda]|uniref:adhesion G-protein coupled receptor F3-like n=1 Tax=Hyla sarda TaxID=327740 RepID=UPI0024C2FA23|nr:adhesion G-protein coupled receptor F3-like [Hyla sarda]
MNGWMTINIQGCEEVFAPLQDNMSIIVKQVWDFQQRSRRAAAVKPPACYIPFIANGLTFSSCTMYGQTRTYWCSTTDSFDRDGLWSWCNGPGTNSAAACVFPFQYLGVLHTACILHPTGYTWCSATSNYDRDGQGIYCLAVGSTTMASTPLPTYDMTSETVNSAPLIVSTGFTSSDNSTDSTQLTEWLHLVSSNMSAEEGLGLIPDLQNYVSSVGPYGFHQDEEEEIINILNNITENVAQSNLSFPVGAVMDILKIANEILNETFGRSGANTTFSPQLLHSFENLLENMEMVDASFKVSYENIDFHCLVASCANLSNENALRIESHVSVAMTPEDSQQAFPPDCLVNYLLLSCRTLNMNFPGQYEEGDGSSLTFQVDSNIFTNVLRLDGKSFHNPNVNLTFQCSHGNYCDHTAVCAFWNFTRSSWSSEGCTTEIANGVTYCHCHHLTSFSVLIAKFIPSSLKNSSVLDYITIAGLAISIASLTICITFQVYVLRFPMNLVAYYRHTTILNASIFLLLSYVSFIAASYITPKESLRLCVGLTFCTHFSLLAFFFWTLVQSIFLFCRLVFVFHHVTKKEFMSLSVGLGYISPSIIAIGTFLYFTPTNDYQKENVCWLQSDSGASMAFNIPTIIILSGNFMVLLVVIQKLLRPSISEGSNEDKEIIKKLVKAVVFCTPQFGLTWAVGIPLMSDGSLVALQYLFVILNPLQGFFIFVFGCLLDKKVMDVIKKRMSKSPVFSSTATTVSTY